MSVGVSRSGRLKWKGADGGARRQQMRCKELGGRRRRRSAGLLMRECSNKIPAEETAPLAEPGTPLSSRFQMGREDERLPDVDKLSLACMVGRRKTDKAAQCTKVVLSCSLLSQSRQDPIGKRKFQKRVESHPVGYVVRMIARKFKGNNFTFVQDLAHVGKIEILRGCSR
ncbi:hypothetical protein N7539_005401 [Penicillium diatomitis]|uniref:Uncharacterized protein n=1 Tax=Penicillium diatomitis TaxID=2819901 RepID=A0A9X0BUP1_9EURO|nr:uncharacterized protein N7539_005401 [Penicillium diatomitis]KAJ5485413.1 hypothetical protein N7539_005401 [Penicillium diatomitis]